MAEPTKEIRCSKCDVPMTKGQFLPDKRFGIATVGMKWAAAEKLQQRGFGTLTTVAIFQYLCPECGLIETYGELKESKDSTG